MPIFTGKSVSGIGIPRILQWRGSRGGAGPGVWERKSRDKALVGGLENYRKFRI